jgi:hypothetical protein
VYRQLPWLQQFGAALVVAPRISARTRGILTEGGISWLEPDGDCRIAIGGLFIERSLGGRPRRKPGAADTRFVADPFSGGALRIVRWLLIEPERSWTLTEIGSRAGLTIGFVSRTFKTLARDAYVERERGSTRLLDRDALLEGWVAAPAPADVPLERVSLADGPSAVLRRVRELQTTSAYAITAEAAAEQIAPHARFSRVEIYVDDPEAWDRALSLTPVPRGGNVVLIRPVDRGVFDGLIERDGLALASRPQVYVDLLRRGGAAAEAAAFGLYPNAEWLGSMRDGGPPRDGEADLDLASLSRGHVLLGADAPRELVLDSEALETRESIRGWVERAYAYWLGDGTRGAPLGAVRHNGMDHSDRSARPPLRHPATTSTRPTADAEVPPRC